MLHDKTRKNSPEIKIIPIKLNSDISLDHICMVTAQPFLNLRVTNDGFKVDRGSLDKHMNFIWSALQVASENASEDAYFILFPELSLPLDMIRETGKISDSLSDNSILLGGMEGVKREEYSDLLDGSANPQEAKYALPDTGHYINCGIILVKEKDHDMQLYLQPKIKASPDEQKIGMIEGKHIFLFKTTNYNFLQLICFDFVGRTQTSTDLLVQDIMQEFGRGVPNGYCLNLDLVFMLQYNENPTHRCFQESARFLLHEGRGTIETRSVVFVNSSAEEMGRSEKFGKSAFYFPRGTWRLPDKSTYPVNHSFALEKTDYGCERARFREDGPCIHKMTYIPRKALGGDSCDICYPFVPPPMCYKIMTDGSLEQGRAVPALEKVLSDNLPLDLAASDRRWHAPNDITLRGEVIQSYNETRNELLNTSIDRMKELTDLLLLCHHSGEGRVQNPDYWEADKEGEAIRDMASSVSILALTSKTVLDVSVKTLTGLLERKFYIAVIDGKGTETPTVLQNEYQKYVEQYGYTNIDMHMNVLLVFCRHEGEQPPNGIAQEIVGFTLISKTEEEAMPSELQDDKRFTSVPGNRVFWHSRASLHGILDENSVNEAKTRLEQKLAPLTT